MGRSLALCLVLGLGPASVRLEAQIFSLSEQQEIELGREASKKVETEMPMLPAGDITDYVSRLGQSLVRYSHRSNLKYSFKVVNSPEINAFALPGGSIYVNRGLLEAADNESEVAGVFGHEISHVVARHSADQMKKVGIANLILGGLGAALGGKGGAMAGITKLGAELGTNAAFMKFSRDDERQADELGARNVYDAGYNPEGMVTFFEKLEHLRQSEPRKLETFFSTHPSPSERVANVSHEIRAFPRKENLKTDSPDFHTLKSRLNKLPKPPAPRQPQ
ncbi:MAG: peptidase M48 [Acidobacteria bacterium]|nr:MAG: peptidase M48 [Acidobacteriota bacterium]